MSKNKKATPFNDKPDMTVSSATDFTGLIPAAPLTEEEVEAYQEMYEFRPDTINISDLPKAGDSTSDLPKAGDSTSDLPKAGDSIREKCRGIDN